MEQAEDDLISLLNAWRDGEKGAEDALREIVRDQLKRIAVFNLGRATLGDSNTKTTGLVHELYALMVRHQTKAGLDRDQFFSFAVQTIHQVLVEEARCRQAAKRQDPHQAPTTGTVQEVLRINSFLHLEEALQELRKADPLKFQIAELYHFSGMDPLEIANQLKISIATLKQEWSRAKAWLQFYLAGSSPQQVPCD